MPIPEHMGGFIAAAVLVTVLPGPDFVLVTRNTALGGRGAGLATAAGSVTGIAAWAVLATAGLSVLVASHPALLYGLRLAGAAYLVYLGGSSILALWRAHRAGAGSAVGGVGTGANTGADTGAGGGGTGIDTDTGSHGGRGAARSGAPYLQGLVNNLLNPKLPVMFVTVLPQFVSAPEAAVAQTALLGAILVAIVVVWWLVYVLGISALSEVMRRRRVRQGIDLAGGVALTAFGVALALAA